MFETNERVVVAAEARERYGPVGQDLDMSGIYQQRADMLLEGFGELAQIVERGTQVHQGREVVRLDGQRLAVAVGGILEPALQVAHPRRQQPALVVIAVDPDQRLQVAGRGVGIAVLERDQREVQPGLRVTIVDRNRPARIGFGFIQPAEPQARRGAVGQRRRSVGQQRQRAREA